MSLTHHYMTNRYQYGTKEYWEAECAFWHQSSRYWQKRSDEHAARHTKALDIADFWRKRYEDFKEDVEDSYERSHEDQETITEMYRQ